MLMKTEATHPLLLSDELSEMCKDQKSPVKVNSWNGGGASELDSTRPHSDYTHSKTGGRRKYLKSQNLTGIKEMVIDFICREDLVITTLKEFFEIFISSIKKQQVFHSELLNPHYEHIGISMDFNPMTSVASLRIFLAMTRLKQ
jgi:hypothetical protein